MSNTCVVTKAILFEVLKNDSSTVKGTVLVQEHSGPSVSSYLI